MKPIELSSPLETVNLDGRRFEVGQLTAEELKAVWGCVRIVSGDAATLEERKYAAALLAFALLRHGAPSLTPEFVAKHLTVEENAKVAREYNRQMYYIVPMQGNA